MLKLTIIWDWSSPERSGRVSPVYFGAVGDSPKGRDGDLPRGGEAKPMQDNRSICDGVRDSPLDICQLGVVLGLSWWRFGPPDVLLVALVEPSWPDHSQHVVLGVLKDWQSAATHNADC